MRQVSSRESTDLEQYIILDTKNFIWLQKLAKLQKFEIFKKVRNLEVSEYESSKKCYMVADHRELLLRCVVARDDSGSHVFVTVTVTARIPKLV